MILERIKKLYYSHDEKGKLESKNERYYQF